MSLEATRGRVAPSVSVVEDVAAREGVDATDLDVPLYESVDPDALDTLLESGDDGRSPQPIRVQFSYHGYDVTVSSDGTVSIPERGYR